jgi:hypothetical protein
VSCYGKINVSNKPASICPIPILHPQPITIPAHLRGDVIPSQTPASPVSLIDYRDQSALEGKQLNFRTWTNRGCTSDRLVQEYSLEELMNSAPSELARDFPESKASFFVAYRRRMALSKSNIRHQSKLVISDP